MREKSLISSALIAALLLTPTFSKENQEKESYLEECRAVGLTACPTPLDQNLPDPKEMLTWSQDERVIGFRNTYRAYEGDTFKPSKNVRSLPKSSQEMPPIEYMIEGETYNFDDYLQRQNVTGLMILKDGESVFEYYAKGNTDRTLWTSRSVAKSIVTLLIGVAIKEGKINSVDDLIVDYIPELKGSAWEDVTLKSLMQHTSGTKWNEDYKDPDSHFSHMTLCEATNDPYGCVFELVKGVEKVHKSGDVWSYNTGGAWLVGLLLERATGETIASYLESSIWQPFGMEHEGVWHALVQGEVNMGGHGFNATLRDWARVGQFVVENSEGRGDALPEDWIIQSTDWTKAEGSPTKATPEGQYGYQWWAVAIDPDLESGPKNSINDDALFWGLGIYGQALAINPKEQLVVAQWSVWEQAETPNSVYDEQRAFVNALTDALHRENDKEEHKE